MPMHAVWAMEGSVEEVSTRKKGFISDVSNACYGMLVGLVVHLWAGNFGGAKLWFWVGDVCAGGGLLMGTE